MSYFNIGLVRGYSSPAFPNIIQIRPELLPSKEISSWAGSIPPFGAVFGSLIAGPLLHYTGRKLTVLSSSPILAASWLLIAFATSWKFIFAGRFLSGLCAGLCLPSAQIYVSIIIRLFAKIILYLHEFIRSPNAQTRRFVVLLGRFRQWPCLLEFFSHILWAPM